MELESFEIGVPPKKNYPMHLVHRDRNYVYNFWPREGESIALACARLKSMLYSCPNHELSREIIIQNFYARLSRNDQTMHDFFLCWFFYEEHY